MGHGRVQYSSHILLSATLLILFRNQKNLAIEGIFLGVQFREVVDLYYFVGLMFADVPIMVNRTDFAGLIFIICENWTSRNFPLYVYEHLH